MSSQKSMLHRPTAKTLLLLGAATILQGCVAAVVPIAAAGLMAGSGDRPSAHQQVAAAPAPIPAPIPAPTPASKPAVAAVPQDRTGSVIFGPREPEIAPLQEQTEEAPELTLTTAPVEAGSAVQRGDALDAKTAISTAPAPAANLAEAGAAAPISGSDASLTALQTTPVERAKVAPPPVSVTNDAGFGEVYRAPGAASNPAQLTSSQAAAALATTSSAAEPAAPPQSPPASLARTAPAAVEPPVSRTTRTVAPTSNMPSPNSVTQLLSYANQRQFTSGENRTSAMLADRISLEPNRAQCGGVKPAVLIDLDPQDGTFSPATATNPPAGLGAGLSQLRAQGVHVAWISNNPEELSNQIRRALTRTGLDIYGRDTVLLIRKDDDRKQTLREEFAKTYCLIAIAGDDRSDFDELYNYLLDPSEAATLEPLYGEGWFLIPQPLISQNTSEGS